MSRSRLFYVLDSMEENEVGDQVATLLGRLSRSRFEPRVVALGPQGTLGSRIREMTVTVHRLDLTGPSGALLAVPRLRHLILSQNPDFLHTFQPWAGAVAQLAAPRGVRVFRTVDRDAERAGWNVGSRIRNVLARRAAARNNGRFFASHDEVRDRMHKRLRLDDIEVVPPGLDIGGIRSRVQECRREDARIQFGLGPDERAVVCITDFVHRGFGDAILEGFAIAATERPGLRLFLVGRGPEEGHARWKAEELRLGDTVVFLGGWPDRWSLWSACDVVVDAGSGWSRTAMQAMAAELPVARLAAEPDNAEDVVGTISGPPTRIARGFLGLVGDEAVKEELRRLGAARIRPHDVATVAARWEEIYQS